MKDVIDIKDRERTHWVRAKEWDKSPLKIGKWNWN